MDNKAAQDAAWIKFLAWVEVNKKTLIVAAAAVAVLIFLAAMVINYQRQKEVRASEALSNIRLPYNPATLPPPGAADQLLKVAEQHPGTKAAPRALLLSAGIAFMEGNYAEAEKRFARVPKEYPNCPWLAEAAYGVAMSLDAQGKTAEATAKYDEIRKRYASSGVIDDTKLALARLNEQSKPEEAYKLYDEIMKQNDPRYSGMGNMAGMHQQALLKKHPELAKLNQPVMPPEMTAVTNRTLVTNLQQQTPPLMLNTNLLPRTLTNATARLSNAAAKLTNAVQALSALTNKVATNLPALITPGKTPVTNRAAAPAPAAK